MTSRTTLLASALGLAVLSGTLGSGKVAVAQGYGTIKGRVVWGGAALPDAPLKVKKGDPNAKDSAACAKEDVPNEDFVVDRTRQPGAAGANGNIQRYERACGRVWVVLREVAHGRGY